VTEWLTACAPVPPLAVTVATKEFVVEPPGAVETLIPPLHPLIAAIEPASNKKMQSRR